MLPQTFNPDLLDPNKQMPRPYVEFITRTTRDADASLKAGAVVMRDVELVVLRAPGSKDSAEKPIEDWLAQLEVSARRGDVPVSWPREYREAYEFWKKGNDLPVDGVPLKTWPPLSPAQLQNLLAIGVRTVEELAAANAEVIQRLGMGGLGLKQMAQHWLDEAKTKGKVVLQAAALQTKLEALEARNKDLEAANAALQARITALEAK